MILSQSLALRVRQIEPLSETLKHIVFEPADGGWLPTAPPGAHLSLRLRGSERDYRNSFSLVGREQERSRYELIVRRTAGSRGGSAFIHDVLRPGHVIESSAPNSQLPLQSRARKHVLISGGIGVTPMLSFLPALRARGARVEMHHIAQSAEATLFERLLAPFGDHDVKVHSGRRGLDLTAVLARQPLGSHLYTCGPTALMEAVRDTALGLGWPEHHIHRESFGSTGGAPFIAQMASTGQDIAVGEHETLLEALERAGAPISSLCRGGACGECATAVVDGLPDHHDHFLTPEQQASGAMIMPCVSRAKSPRLTLDL